MGTGVQATYSEHHMSLNSAFSGMGGREFVRTVIAELELGAERVVLDCAEWRVLDFSLLSALVRCTETFRSRGALLELANLPTEMRANIRELRLQNRLRLQD